MAILLLDDHDGSHLSDQTAKTLTVASHIAKGQGSDITVLVAGKAPRLPPNCQAFPRCCLPKATSLPTIWPSHWPT
ncbi:electron transfer flavoprotein subunit alpha [Rhizobium grahamii CCGE 502]|uniref:Electron transfer flavoprotein subunit alpha n=1 Tax=Rhizobium grahamii CCGE 502 TaxID=990285 RepID=S3HBJ5_9HYPH|nr:electron transfer flavoprotein subunit alpha [Rhizobium grahamii CCGE 502]